MAYDNGQSSSWRKKRNSIVTEQRVTEPQQILVEGERQAMVQSNRSIEQDKEAGIVEESAQHKKDARVITGIVDDAKLELLKFGGAKEDHRIKGIGYVVRECDGLVLRCRIGGCGFQVMENVRWVEIRGWGALSSAGVGLRQSLPESDTSDDKSVVLETHMSNSPIWHMNRLWEDNMLEDWRVLESSVAESGKRNREVSGIGTALVVAEVPRARKAATIELNGGTTQSTIIVRDKSQYLIAGRVV
ncbi:hypothetical protein V6N12_067855 [Hibiscus sabdariffa]|uniref:Uncharacterized protein n=1 Tax=Hibiscus sabdariffa TaxID=183260 RepID=A0ABR2FNA5_9ROSI